MSTAYSGEKPEHKGEIDVQLLSQAGAGWYQIYKNSNVECRPTISGYFGSEYYY
jgi:hypothetical protein